MARIIRAVRSGPAILPAEICDARGEAGRIVERARAEARALRERAEQQAENIREQAREQGCEQGRQQGLAEAATDTSDGTNQTLDSARELTRTASDLQKLVQHFRC